MLDDLEIADKLSSGSRVPTILSSSFPTHSQKSLRLRCSRRHQKYRERCLPHLAEILQAFKIILFLKVALDTVIC
jgi:hypothetical protein